MENERIKVGELLISMNVKRIKPNRLVVFDVEGVLLPERRYLLAAARKIGVWGFVKVVVIGIFYEIGLLSLESALRKVFKLFRGSLVDDLFRLYRNIPLILGAEKVFERLRRAKCTTALISSGFPLPFVKDLAVRLKADYAFGLELEMRDGFLTGKIWGKVLKPEGKALILKKLLEREGLSPQDCVVVADDRNNLPMFSLCAVRIGYNPDFIISVKSDFAIKGRLSDVLPLIIGDASQSPSPALSRNEVVREVIHLSGFLVPFVLWFRLVYYLNRYLVSLLLLLVTILYAASELAKMEGTYFPVLHTITRKAATEAELHEFATDPIFFALGIAFSLILFHEPVCYASIAILVLGDGFAMIFGRMWGRTILPFNKSKKVEGSVFGFLFAFMGALLFISPVKALIGAAIGMIVECLPFPISDNLTIPLAVGLVLMIL